MQRAGHARLWRWVCASAGDLLPILSCAADRRGVVWLHARYALAHPLDGRDAVSSTVRSGGDAWRRRPGLRVRQPARRGSVACTADRGGPSWPSREVVAGNATATIEALPAPAVQKSSRVARTSISLRTRATIWPVLKGRRTCGCRPKTRRPRGAAPHLIPTAQRYRSHPNPSPNRNRHPRFPCLSRRRNHRRRIRSRPLRRALTSGIAADARGRS
jgi:hypothetical protein